MPQTNKKALNRAVNGGARGPGENETYAQIFLGFQAKGLLTSQIIPRVNILTYRAWLAKGKKVKEGEQGVRVLFSYNSTKNIKIERSYDLYHESQTEDVRSYPQQLSATADNRCQPGYPQALALKGQSAALCQARASG